MKIHQGLSESRIKSSGRPPGFGYLGQQWMSDGVCYFDEADSLAGKVKISILLETPGGDEFLHVDHEVRTDQ